jgi:glutaredoxin
MKPNSVTIYGSALCANCIVAKNTCKREGINYQYVDVTEEDVEPSVFRDSRQLPRIEMGNKYYSLEEFLRSLRGI